MFVIAGTNAGKSLTYQTIPKVTGGIVLVISPTIALMEDQRQWLSRRGIPAVALISTMVAEDPDIWKRVDKGDYAVVIGLPEVLFGPHSPFWKRTVRDRDEFCQRLACIVIDEAHSIWGWRSFRKKYKMIDHLKGHVSKDTNIGAIGQQLHQMYWNMFANRCSFGHPVRLYKRVA